MCLIASLLRHSVLCSERHEIPTVFETVLLVCSGDTRSRTPPLHASLPCHSFSRTSYNGPIMRSNAFAHRRLLPAGLRNRNENRPYMWLSFYQARALSFYQPPQQIRITPVLDHMGNGWSIAVRPCNLTIAGIQKVQLSQVPGRLFIIIMKSWKKKTSITGKQNNREIFLWVNQTVIKMHASTRNNNISNPVSCLSVLTWCITSSAKHKLIPESTVWLAIVLQIQQCTRIRGRWKRSEFHLALRRNTLISRTIVGNLLA